MFTFGKLYFAIAFLLGSLVLGGLASAQGSASGYEWRNWSDELIFTQGEDFREFFKEGKTYAGGEATARGAYDRFIYLCEKLNTKGCIYAVDTARELMKDKSLEIDTYFMACENGEAKFCGAGYMSTKEDDKSKAEKFAKKGCGLGDEFLCRGEAWLVSLKPKSDLSPAEEMAQYTKICDADVGRDHCAFVGSVYAGFNDEYMQFKNISLAQKYLNKGCAAGHFEACNNAAIINDPDQGYLANPEGMAVALTTLCQMSETNLCVNGLAAYSRGIMGLKKDLKRAAFFAGISCDRFQESCYNASYYRYVTNPSNTTDIMRYSSKACDLGDLDGCNMTGNILIRGTEYETAMQSYRKACALGDADTCAVVNNNEVAAAHRARLDEEYKRCRGGCPAGSNSTTSRAPNSNWEPSYCANHRRDWRLARDRGQPFVKSGACGEYR